MNHKLSPPISSSDVTTDKQLADDEEYLAGLVRQLSPDSQRIVNAIEKVKSVYVPCGRDTLFQEMMQTFLEHVLARRDKRRDDGRIFYVTGASGAGKTRAVQHLFANTPLLQPNMKSYGAISPIISVSLTGQCTLGTLGEMILNRAGYPIQQKLSPADLWKTLPERLHHRKVLIVHIDETQNMLRKTEKEYERKALANSLKGAMNDQRWPISFLVSGLPETDDMAKLDEQFERRGMFLKLPDIDIENERELVINIIRKMAEAAELDVERLVNSDIPDRAAHAAKYRYGRVTQVVLAAIQNALQHNSRTLGRFNFAGGYLNHSHARGHDDRNIFIMDDWMNEAPGSFMLSRNE